MTTIPMPRGKVVVSFFDYTGNAVREWAEHGYTCYCFDILHDPHDIRYEKVGKGTIFFIHADLDADSPSWDYIRAAFAGADIALIFGFPPCDDMAVSGAKHFAKKAAEDPEFQEKAKRRATAIAEFAEGVGAEYCVENPRSVLSTLWRKPDHKFHPNEYGGYLPEDDQHPRWPEYIPPRDAYTKDTWLWTSPGFVMPPKKGVIPEIMERVSKKTGKLIRGSRQFMKLGGKSAKTKAIRNETPRGFALAVFLSNCADFVSAHQKAAA